MITYAANIEPLFGDADLCEKIVLAKQAGIDAVEFWDWNGRDVKKIKETCDRWGVKVTAFSGQKPFSLCDGENSAGYIEWMKRSIDAAKYLNCDTLIAFSNHFADGKSSDLRGKYSRTAQMANMVRTLTLLAPVLEDSGITLLLEPLHNHGADAGMLLTDTKEGADIVRAIQSPKVRLLCDFFHMQLMHGDLLENFKENADIVPYVHIADAPDRHEPGTGEINYKYLMDAVRASGFDGTACLEFFPSGDSAQTIKTAKEICGFE